MKANKIFIYFLVISVIVIAYSVTEPVFTSPIKIARLLRTEDFMIETLENYIRQREEILNSIKKYAEILNEPRLKTEEQRKFVSNPLQTFSLLSRVTEVWNNVKKLMEENSYEDLNSKVENDASIIVPTERDILAVTNLLTVLQETYDLPLDLLLQGYIRDFKARKALSVSDCISIGHYSYKSHLYFRAIKWLEGCLKMYEIGRYTNVNLKKQILELLYKSYLISHKFSESLIYVDKFIDLEPRNREAKKSKHLIQSYLNPTTRDEKNKIHKLCRQMNVGSVKNSLKCRYNQNNSFLKIAPLKEEELSLKPKILLYHQVVHEMEAKHVIDLSLSTFNENLAKTDVNTKFVARSHQYGSFSDGDDQILKKLTERSFDMTGLANAAFARTVHVQHYGFGETFSPLVDFNQRAPPFHAKFGNVVANVLFYLNDDYEGGRIVFESLNLSIPVERNGAIVWHHEINGVDYGKTLKFIGCPVYDGYAWVGKKTFRKIGHKGH